jgi:hypothetical protein
MNDRDRALCAAYGVISLVALVATWWNNIDHFTSSSSSDGAFGFFEDAFANPAASSIAWDVAFMFAAAAILMVVEARRLGVRYVWAYVVGGAAIAISVTFPLFLIARQRKLAEQGSTPTGGPAA